MADTITDNRTLLIANEAADADLDDLAGAADTGGDNTEVFIEGSGSRSFKVSQTVDGRLFDNGSAVDWSSNHFYTWLKCTSLTDTLANGGVRIRFCGATVTDWFEKYVFGGSIGSVNGWEMLVIDIEKARADAVAGTDGGTNGTTPATTAIRYVGIVFDVPGMISGNTDNCFIDAMWRLPANTPGIIVQGQDQTVSAHDWTWQDIVDAGDVSDTAKAWGSILQKDGIITINTPIRWGTNDATTHGFSDTNIVVAWQDALVADDFYELDIIGGSGTQSWTMGVKVDTGDDATGSQGLTMVAESAGVRYKVNANDANLDAANFYGCQFIHGSNFVFNDIATSVISCSFNDCDSALVSNAIDFLRCQIVNANTAEGIAFITTDDLTDIVFCNFTRGITGHAIELITPIVATQASKGNLFDSYGPAFKTFNTGTDVDGTNEELDITAHPYITGDPIVYDDDGGAVSMGLTDQTIYWVRNLTANSISIHTSRADANSDTARVNLTSSGSETHILWSADAAVLNDTDGAVTINVSDLGDTPTHRNESTTETTTVNNTVTLTINVEDEAKVAVQNAQTSIFLLDSPFTQLMNEDTTAGGVAAEAYSYLGDVDIKWRVRKSETADNPRYEPRSGTGQITSSGFTQSVTLKVNTKI